jgi:acyl-CoA hydrolase
MNHTVLKLLKPNDLNSTNTFFGGEILKWVDEVLGTFSLYHLESYGIAIVSMEKTRFHAPSRQKDLLEMGVDVTSYGKTSLRLSVNIHNLTADKLVFSIDEAVLVALDENGKPFPHGKSFSEN